MQECEAARAKRVTPCSLYGRLTGEAGYVSDVQEQREPCRDKEAERREWVAQKVPRRMTRQEVAMAMEGRVEEEGVARAMGGLLGVLMRHARAATVARSKCQQMAVFSAVRGLAQSAHGLPVPSGSTPPAASKSARRRACFFASAISLPFLLACKLECSARGSYGSTVICA